MKEIICLLLLTFLHASGKKPFQLDKVRAKSESRTFSDEPAKTKSHKSFPVYTRLNSATRPAYLNSFYQILFSLRSVKTTLLAFNADGCQSTSSAVTLFYRVKEMLSIMGKPEKTSKMFHRWMMSSFEIFVLLHPPWMEFICLIF